jgi:hypothetical protein
MHSIIPENDTSAAPESGTHRTASVTAEKARELADFAEGMHEDLGAALLEASDLVAALEGPGVPTDLEPARGLLQRLRGLRLTAALVRKELRGQ